MLGNENWMPLEINEFDARKLSNFFAYIQAGKLSIAFSAGNSIANTIQHRDRYFPESCAGQDQKKSHWWML